MGELKSKPIFCKDCGSIKEKGSRFCDKCRKETPNKYVLHCITANIKITMGKVRFLREWGEKNWKNFIVACSGLFAFSTIIIELLPLGWRDKIALVIIVTAIILYLCFLNRKSKQFIANILNSTKKEIH